MANATSVDYALHGRRLRLVIDGVAGEVATNVVDAVDQLFGPYRVDPEPTVSAMEIAVRIEADLETVPPAERVVGEAADGVRFVRAAPGKVSIAVEGLGCAQIDAGRARADLTLVPGGDDPAAFAAHRLVEPVVVELLKARGLFALHAAGVTLGEDAMLLCGASGSGKSTLGVAMGLRGAGFLGDDTCYLELAEDGRVWANARWSDLHLTDASLENLMPADIRSRARRPHTDSKWFLPVADVPVLRPVERARVRWVVFPRIVDADASTLTPLDSVQALPGLLRQSLVPSDPAAAPGHFDALARMCTEARCYALDSGRDLAGTTEILRRLAP